MNWVTTILAVLKFIATELPKFISEWRKYSKDSTYESQSDKFEAAYKAYIKTVSLKSLKDLEETQ